MEPPLLGSNNKLDFFFFFGLHKGKKPSKAAASDLEFWPEFN